jgi:hypothetical protein
MYGRISFPPFASEAIAVMTCSGVAAMPCPKLFVARSTGVQFGSLLLRSSPSGSPPSPTPVYENMQNITT